MRDSMRGAVMLRIIEALMGVFTSSAAAGAASARAATTSTVVRRMLRMDSLHDHRDSLPAPDTERGQPVARATAPQLVQERDHQAPARRAGRMAEGDGAAVDVRLVAEEAELTLHGEKL